MNTTMWNVCDVYIKQNVKNKEKKKKSFIVAGS